MERMSSADAAFLLFDDRTNPLHFGNLGLFAPPVGGIVGSLHAHLAAAVEARLHLAPAFRRSVAQVAGGLDQPWWIEDPDFDLDYHVRHIRLPAPGDWRQLWLLAARIHARPLDPTRPLWEMTIIEGLDAIEGLPQGAFALVFKQHLASAAPYGGMNVESALHVADPDEPPPGPTAPWLPDPVPQPVDLLVRSLLSNPCDPERVPRMLLRLNRNVAPLLGGVWNYAAGIRRAPWCRLNLAGSAPRVIETRRLPLDKLRAVRHTLDGVTINDLVLALCGGALRRYLREKDDLPEAPLVALAPLTVLRHGSRPGHAPRDARSVPVFLELGTQREDVLDRLADISAQTRSIRAVRAAVDAEMLTEHGRYYPSVITGQSARLAARLAFGRQHPAFNVVINNVPGSQRPLFVGGAGMIARFGLGALVERVALNLHVQSYCGELMVSATGARTLLPDLERFGVALDAAWAELTERTTVRGRVVALPRFRSELRS